MNESKQPLSKPNKPQPIWLPEIILECSESLLHIIGYIFLIFAVLDYLIILIPPQFTNSVWEFQTMGQLVERSAIPLIGLVLVFYRPEQAVDRWELRLLKLISWLCLLIGIFYLMMLPLGREHPISALSIDTHKLLGYLIVIPILYEAALNQRACSL